MASRYVWERYNAVLATTLGGTTTHQGSKLTVVGDLYAYNGEQLNVSAGTTIYYAFYTTRQLVENTNGTTYAKLSTLDSKGSFEVQSVISTMRPYLSVQATEEKYLVYSRTDNFPATINAYAYAMRGASGQRWTAMAVKQDSDTSTKLAGAYISWTIPTTMTVQGSAAGTVSSAQNNTYPNGAASGNYWYVYKGSDNITPSKVTIPTIIYGGETITITVTPRNGTLGGTKSYLYEVSTNNGTSWTTVGLTTAATARYEVPKGTGTIVARVRVQDGWGFTDTDYIQSTQVTVINNDAPTAPASITVPENIQDTQTITISWAASTDPDDNLEGYILEVQINGGSWTQLYDGANLSYQHAMAESYNTLVYRVKAYDSYGAESEYTTSEQRTITHNLAPTAPGNLQVTTVVVGEDVTITWTASTDSDGTIASYVLERSINESEYGQIYTGTDLTYTDEILTTWATVSYRVKAVDNEGASSEYTTSQTYTVQAGMLYVSGPLNNMGTIDRTFDFNFTVKYTGNVQPFLIDITVLYDGNEIYTNDEGFTDIEYIVEIDNRIVTAGEHHITVIVESENYTGTIENYTYSVSELELPDGGYGVIFEKNDSKPIFPATLASLVYMNDGSTLSEWYKQVLIAISNVETGGFVEMETELPTTERTNNTLYGLILVDLAE